jgi:GntR family transcriptional regulator, transcriptional repressor for pyruvate dehydrogenase complex
MAFREVVRNPAYEQVAGQLREAILDGTFAPGDELPAERELCGQFGVSRTTVREALRALQAQGLAVTTGPTAPLRVPPPEQLSAGPLRDSLVHLLRLGRVPLRDLVELRCALEAAAVAGAATRPAGDGDRAARIAEAHAALAEMHSVTSDPDAFEAADVRFHLALVAASGNEALQLVMLAVRDSVSAHLREALQGLRAPERAVRRLLRQHEAILAAVEAGDARDAEVLLRDHVMGFYRAAAPGRAPGGTNA